MPYQCERCLEITDQGNGSLTAALSLERSGESKVTREALGLPPRTFSERLESAIRGGVEESALTEMRQELLDDDELWQKHATDFYRAWGVAVGAKAVRDAFESGGNEEVSLASQALLGWAQRDPKAASDWVYLLPENDDRRYVIAELSNVVVSQGSPSDPMDLIHLRSAQSFASELVASLVDQESPATTLDWVNELPEGSKMRDVGTHETFRSWSMADPEIASATLVTLEAGPQRDRAIVAFVSEIVGEDATAAAAWAETIQDEGLREYSLAAIAKALDNARDLEEK